MRLALGRAFALASVLLILAGCSSLRSGPMNGGAEASSTAAALPGPAAVSAERPAAESPVQMSGRLNLRVRRTDTGAADGGTLLFEFEGSESQGRLLLQSVIGTTVAQVRWNPAGAEVATPQGSRSGARLDDVASALLGESLPLAALLHWIRGEPWSGAPHRRHAEGFEQLGWQVSLDAWHERVVTAQRPARADRPVDTEITVRARLDDPAPGSAKVPSP